MRHLLFILTTELLREWGMICGSRAQATVGHNYHDDREVMCDVNTNNNILAPRSPPSSRHAIISGCSAARCCNNSQYDINFIKCDASN